MINFFLRTKSQMLKVVPFRLGFSFPRKVLIGRGAWQERLNEKLKGILFFRTIYFLPTICSGVAIYVLWKFSPVSYQGKVRLF